MAMQVKIRVRSGTSEEWAAKDPVLLLAEPGYDSSTRTLKVGDGSSKWSELPTTVTTDQIDAAVANSAAVHNGVHAASHAQGGVDAVSPASIGAIPASDDVNFIRSRGLYPVGAHVDTMTDAGAWWVSGQAIAANGFPWGPNNYGILTVVRANGSTYVQQTYQSSNATPVVWTRTNRAGVWSVWEPVGVLRGSGSPEGVVAAPIGSMYIDLTGAAGESVWIKVAGTAEAGWDRKGQKWAISDTGPGVDANKFIDAGIYLVAGTALNTPGNYTGFIEVLTRRDAPRYTVQRFVAFSLVDSGAREWTRSTTGSHDGTTWSTWKAVADGGDTGWRTIPTNPAVPMSAGSLQVRRVGNLVRLRLSGLQPAAGTAQPVHILASSGTEGTFSYVGFRPNSGLRAPFVVTRSNSIAEWHNLVAWGSGNLTVLTWYSWQTVNSGAVTNNLTWPSTSPIIGEVTWITDDPWPTTLPGT